MREPEDPVDDMSDMPSGPQRAPPPSEQPAVRGATRAPCSMNARGGLADLSHACLASRPQEEPLGVLFPAPPPGVVCGDDCT